MMCRKSKVAFLLVWGCLALLWVLFLASFRYVSATIYPEHAFEIYPLTDAAVGGSSTCNLEMSDTTISADINIRSGVAYPYAGIGFNLMSVNKRPAGYFDFSKYDSIAFTTSVGRMKSVTLRIWNDDPIYSRKGEYLSYRPLVFSAPASFKAEEVKLAISQMKVPEWWLAAQGLDEDDGLTFFHRGALLEVLNGDGILRGIPDNIELKSVRLWGENHDFVKAMYFAAVLWIGGLVCFLILSFKKKPDVDALKKTMDQAAKLLRESDRSIAEIALAIGEKSPSAFEKHFQKIFKMKPLEYRRKNA